MQHHYLNALKTFEMHYLGPAKLTILHKYMRESLLYYVRFVIRIFNDVSRLHATMHTLTSYFSKLFGNGVKMAQKCLKMSK